MSMRYRVMSIVTSFSLLMLGGTMLLALDGSHFALTLLVVEGVVIIAVALVGLGMSFMLPDDVRCPSCGHTSRVHVRWSGRPELRHPDS